MATASASSNGPSAVPDGHTKPVLDGVCHCTVEYVQVKVLLFYWSNAPDQELKERYDAHFKLLKDYYNAYEKLLREEAEEAKDSEMKEAKDSELRDFREYQEETKMKGIAKYKEETVGFSKEMGKVKDFFLDDMNYKEEQVEFCAIPVKKNDGVSGIGAQATVDEAVERNLCELNKIGGQKRTLLIIYYAGHALPDDGKEITARGQAMTQIKKQGLRQQSVWAPFGSMPDPRFEQYLDVQKVKWHEIQKKTLMGTNRTSDLLLILDCCYAGQAARFEMPAGGSTKRAELLAAAPMGQTAVGPGDDSFTNKMVDEMREMLKEDSSSINIKLLHGRMSKMVTSTTDPKSPRGGDKAGPTPKSNIDLYTQPYHVDMVAVSATSSIILQPLPKILQPLPKSEKKNSAANK